MKKLPILAILILVVGLFAALPGGVAAVSTLNVDTNDGGATTSQGRLIALSRLL